MISRSSKNSPGHLHLFTPFWAEKQGFQQILWKSTEIFFCGFPQNLPKTTEKKLPKSLFLVSFEGYWFGENSKNTEI